MAPRSTRPAATAKKLVDVMTLDGEEPNNDKGEKKPYGRPISYFPNGKHMINGSMGKWARRWDLQTGEEIVEARFVCEREVWAIAVSRDSRWVVTGGGDLDHNDLCELKAWEVETGMMKTFKGHAGVVTCVDISVDNKLLASGSLDHTARIWDLDTGKLVAGPFECVDGWVGAVRFSQDSKKLAVKSGDDDCLEVWDIQEQKLDRRAGKGGGGVLPDAPVFWTTKDRSIIAAFSLEDFNVKFGRPTTIYEFDASTLETVGAPFEGHTSKITGLALSFDCALLASSAHHDSTIKLWAFESRQLLASFDVHNPSILTLSPNSRQLAYTSFDPSRIHICDIPPDILTRLWPEQATCSTIAPEHSRRTDPLNSHPTRHPATVRRIPVSWSPAPRPLRSSHPEQPTFVRQLRKLLPSYLRKGKITPVQNDEPRDPLNFPATSHLLPIGSAQAATQLRPTAAQSISSPPSATSRTRLRHLSNWWPIRGDHSPPPVVDVPLAQGKLRNAAAGAPKGNDGCIRDEEFDSRPPSPNPDSQRASATTQTDTGEHGSGRLCFCL